MKVLCTSPQLEALWKDFIYFKDKTTGALQTKTYITINCKLLKPISMKRAQAKEYHRERLKSINFEEHESKRCGI